MAKASGSQTVNRLTMIEAAIMTLQQSAAGRHALAKLLEWIEAEGAELDAAQLVLVDVLLHSGHSEHRNLVIGYLRHHTGAAEQDAVRTIRNPDATDHSLENA